MPIVEFVWWSSTDEFLADFDALFKPTVDHVSAAPGCLKVYYGLELEDKTHFWMVVVWKSHAHHQAMMDRPDYPWMVARLKPFFRDEKLKMSHVEFNNDSTAAFEAPISAILFLDCKESQTNEDVDEALQTWMRVIDFGPNSHPPAVWGAAQEDERHTIVVIGRKHLEVKEGALEDSSSSYLEAIGELRKISNIQSIHVRFQSK